MLSRQEPSAPEAANEPAAAATTTGRSVATDPWAALAQARTAEQLCQAWLPVLCGMLPHARSGVILLQDADGSYAPVAIWPGQTDLSHLGDVAQEALVKGQGVVRRDAGNPTQFAYPLDGGGRLFGAVVLELQTEADDALSQAMRMLHWGVGWLMDLHNRRQLGVQESRLARSSFLFDLALAALAETDSHKASLAIVNRLAQHFGCHQVQLGLEKGKTVQVSAVSHSATFDEKTNLVNLAALAMNEAFDQRATVVVPEPEEGASLITAALRHYGGESGSAALCAVPLEAADRVVAVWLLERDTPFTRDECEALETLALTMAPILELKLTAEEGLLRHSRRSWQTLLRRTTDTSRPGIKLLVLLGALLIVFLALYPADHRVASQAVVEGAIQRVAVAPFQGYIRQAPARAGDIVQKGQVLAVLEDKDLRLERVRWESELEVAVRKEREAMAKADRVALRLASAQANQARAQLDLTLEKLSRVEVVAPFDGVVVRGDLSQELGSPVEQGKVLFELAPLDAWRVILKVDERDIAWVKLGEPGELVLTSLPGQAYPLTVKRITPVSVAEDGRNYFRVEAELSDKAEQGPVPMRPGMEGVAKVNAGQRSLLWIWTHRFTDWLRLKAWEWML
ncbi:MAG: HlyD family efflux transporter periplasmic adaptor subunit [Rhodoferax sp.]|nr:HlyD family efflux transporter periplasmic adaptor subunit [Rhodoferax sp.]MCW5629129.1 HlyD family efflux transporter periplasmic adaptor subunit [Rhodoferax sp.]